MDDIDRLKRAGVDGHLRLVPPSPEFDPTAGPYPRVFTEEKDGEVILMVNGDEYVPHEQVAGAVEKLVNQRIRAAQVQAGLLQRIAELERHNELLLEEIKREQNAKKFYELRLKEFNRLWHTEEIPEPLKTWGFNIIANGTPRAAIDGGALPSLHE